MKHILVFLTFAIAASLFSAFAQTAMATLEHGQELKVFNGTNSFANALKAAEDGDIIYLGPGNYNCTDITKQVTIKGAGAFETDGDDQQVTYVNIGTAYLNINLPDDEGIEISGINFTGVVNIQSGIKSSLFSDCVFSTLYVDANTANVTFKDCQVKEIFWMKRAQSNMLWLNSYIRDCRSATNATTIYFKNCLLKEFERGGWQLRLNSATFENCIVICQPTTGKDNTWINCIITSTAEGSKQNCWVLTESEIEEIWSGDWWKLNADAASKYIGTDGKQIGWYGGSQPFTTAVSGPRITKMELPAETDENGKISVTISVSNNE